MQSIPAKESLWCWLESVAFNLSSKKELKPFEKKSNLFSVIDSFTLFFNFELPMMKSSSPNSHSSSSALIFILSMTLAFKLQHSLSQSVFGVSGTKKAVSPESNTNFSIELLCSKDCDLLWVLADVSMGKCKDISSTVLACVSEV